MKILSMFKVNRLNFKFVVMACYNNSELIAEDLKMRVISLELIANSSLIPLSESIIDEKFSEVCELAAVALEILNNQDIKAVSPAGLLNQRFKRGRLVLVSQDYPKKYASYVSLKDKFMLLKMAISFTKEALPD